MGIKIGCPESEGLLIHNDFDLNINSSKNTPSGGTGEEK
jgi:hypothetical protein